MLQRILRGRLTFTQRMNPVSQQIDGYDSLDRRFDKLFSGIASPRPRSLDPNDLTRHRRLWGPYDNDYGRLLERAQRGRDGVPNEKFRLYRRRGRFVRAA